MRVSVTGAGIHSGLDCTVTLHPAEGAVRFRRGAATIPASLEFVTGAERATSLGNDGEEVHLVEHLLAALRIAGRYGGLVVEVSRSELPILDGSALPWLELIRRLGPPPAPPAPLELMEALEVRAAGGVARLAPGDEHLSYDIRFEHPAIGAQRFEGGPSDYEALANARTFGFRTEWAALKERGLARGATLERAIVFGDDGPLNPLRHPFEPVRHKALDALGDLALLGRPLKARVAFERGSHALHHLAARAALGALASPRAR